MLNFGKSEFFFPIFSLPRKSQRDAICLYPVSILGV